jgi:hypothetical protein
MAVSKDVVLAAAILLGSASIISECADVFCHRKAGTKAHPPFRELGCGPGLEKCRPLYPLRGATEDRSLNCVQASAQSNAHCETSAVASYVLASLLLAGSRTCDNLLEFMERAKGFEPSTPTLATLYPHIPSRHK